MSRDEQFDPADETSLAVVGMAGRFPGAQSVEEFWERLRDGVETISFFDDEELIEAGVSRVALSQPNYVKARGYLEGADMFDAFFFGFTPREAEIMNPQHRLLLECAWEALENAGYDPDRQRGPVGVFAGGGLNFYLMNVSARPDLMKSGMGWQAGLLNWQDTLTTNVSYRLNLRGPSLDVQTFCSTSLVAVHIACQSLLSGECDMALAGGVKVAVPLKSGYVYQEGGINPPDGHCRAFDAQAQGTPSGSGVGLVVLRRLADALAAGDYIHAVIRGSAINNDGAAKVGFTAPGIDGQARVIAEALAVAGADAETISYVETHGTGTPLGDPVEIAALTKAFGAARRKNGCAVGSVKTNVGHLDAAAGVAGLIKTILSLKHGMIPPSLHYTTPNPQINFGETPFFVNTRLAPWEANGSPRRAGVSSFGIGGTNAHVVVEEAPPHEPAGGGREWQLLCASARTPAALDKVTSNLARHLREHPELSLNDVAHTLHVGRRAFARRRVLVCRGREDALASLEPLDPQRIHQATQEAADRPAIFMFPGTGAQYPDMARGLYRAEPEFRVEVDRCLALLKPLFGYDPGEILFPADERREEAERLFKQTGVIFPLLFVVEYALAKLLIGWGVRPRAMIGHSFGEYVAACIAGVMSVEDALSLVTLRGRLMDGTPRGGMLSVPLPEEEARELLGADCSVAALNAPGMTVVSGPADAIDALEGVMSERGLDASRLRVEVAAHSPLMRSIVETFVEAVEKISLRAPAIPYVSNVTGTWITAEEATDPRYWAEHLLRPVRFSEGLHELLREKPAILLEVGPGRSLGTLVRQHPDKGGEDVIINSVRHPRDEEADEAVLLTALGKLWLAGARVDWHAFYAGRNPRRVPLPTYPFERQRFWIDGPSEDGVTAAQPGDAAGDKPSDAAHKKRPPAEWFYLPVWRRSLPPPPPPADERDATWVIFGEAGGFSGRLARRLERDGRDVITVLAGERFEGAGGRVYRLRPDRRDDYDALVGELRAAGRLPSVIVHAWAAARDEAESPSLALLDECLRVGFYSLLHLTQALAEHSVTAPVRIEVLTSDGQDVTGGERLRAEKATVFAPCKVIRQEYANLLCRSIDVTLPDAASWREEKLLDLLSAELGADTADTEIAYRDNRRWSLGFEQIRRGEAPAEQTLLRRGGVYLIAGGLGRVGSSFAGHLARAAGARLALVGRTPLPDRSEWARLLETGGADDRVAARIRTLQALESLGAEVLAVEADVTDEQQMRRAVEQTCERFGALHGVIHAVKGGGRSSHMIPDMGRDEAENYFHPKARGLYVLDKVLRGRSLDFCLLTSTISSVLGGLGLFSVTATNALLDSFAQRMSQLSPVPWISVDWDFWRFAEPRDQGRALGKTFAELGVTPEEGVAVLGQLLTRITPTRVVVSSGDLHARIAQWVSPEGEPGGAQAETADTARHPRPDLTNIYVAPSSRVERTVAEIWQELLGIEQIGAHDNFFELGGHSLLATQIITRLRETFQINLPLRSLFENPTIRESAAAIEDALVREIGKLSEEEAERLLQQEV